MKLKLGIPSGINVGRLGIPMLSGGATPVSPPAAPTGLSATPASTSQINLAWTDASSDETAFRVYRSTDGSSYSQIGSDLAAGTQAYNDTTITAGQKYYYKVAAVNAGGETLSTAATANTLTLTLTAYWKLDEASGNRADSVGSNPMTDTGTTGNVAGVVGNAVNVNGGASYLSAASNATLQTGDISFWVDGWFYCTSTSTYPTVLGKEGATREFSIWVDKDTNKLAFSVFRPTNNAKTLESTQTLSLNTWTYFAAWHNAVTDTMYLQINGNAAASMATTGALQAAGTDAFKIGASGDGLTRWPGRIDEVGFWKRVPDTAEITARYNGGAGVTYPF